MGAERYPLVVIVATVLKAGRPMFAVSRAWGGLFRPLRLRPSVRWVAGPPVNETCKNRLLLVADF